MATTIGTVAPYKLGSPPDFGTLYSGRALDFDGVTDYVNCGNLTLGTDDWTQSAWINQSGTDGAVMASGNHVGAGDTLIYEVSGVLEWRNRDNSGDEEIVISSSSLDGTGWNHIAVTRSGTTVSTYLNGVLANTGTIESNYDFTNAYDFLIGARAAGERFWDGKITNVQIWDKAWSLSDVQYAYTHPEKLITDNSAVTSGTTISNLKLWYPCTEGNPRSPQTTVYDGSPKGLGSEMMDTGESTYETGTGSWTTVGTNTVTNVNEQVVITYVNTSNNASLLYFTADEAATVDTVDGKVYRLQLDAKYGGTPDSGVPSIKLRNESGDQSWNLSTTMTTYVRYFTDMAGGSPYIAPQNMAGTGTTVTVDNLSLKEVKMGNHGTTTFYGDEQISDTNDRTFAGASNWANAGGSNAFDSYDETTGGVLTVIPDDDATYGQYCILDGANWEDAMVVGRTYRLSYKLTITSYSKGTLRVGMANDATSFQDYNSYEANQAETTETVDFVYDSDIEILLIYAYTGCVLTAVFDDFSIKEVGVAAGWTTADAEPLIPQTALMGMSKPMVFDGVDDAVKVDDAIGDLGSTASVSMWVKKSSTSGNQYLWDARGDGGNGTGYTYIGDGATTLDNSAGTRYVDGVAAVTVSADGKWHHVVISGATIDVDEDFKIGSNKSLGSSTFDGEINEVSLWDKTLSLAEIQTIFNNGIAYDVRDTDLGYSTTYGSSNLKGYWRNDGVSTWTDLSGNTSSDGDVSGSPDTILLPEGTTSGKDILGFPLTHTNNGWLNLSGSEYVEVDEAIGTISTFAGTVSLWVYIDDISPDPAERFIVFSDTDGNTYMQIYNVDGKFRVFYRIAGTTKWDVDTDAVVFATGTWYHVSVVHNGTEAVLYVDGTAPAQTFVTTTDKTLWLEGLTAYDNVRIGNRSFNSVGEANFFNGKIDEVRIYNRALSAGEVLKNYKHGKGKHKN